jgi:hypothetical protein
MTIADQKRRKRADIAAERQREDQALASLQISVEQADHALGSFRYPLARPNQTV